MATILQSRTRLQAIANKAVLESLLMEQVKRFSGVLIDLQQLRLEQGKDTEGNIIGRYKRSTELISLFETPRPIRPKTEGEPYNFEWTGGLFDGMFISTDDKEAIFSSKDSKTPLLTAKYKDLFGLDNDAKVEALTKYIYPAFMEAIRKKLGY